MSTNATTSNSQIGATGLTSNDSNLFIENHQDERVVLSERALLKLTWSIHSKTITGDTIMKTILRV